MKKPFCIIILIISVITLTGCYSSTQVVSKQRLDNTVTSVEKSMRGLGFRKNGELSGKNSDVTQSAGILYMPYVGYVPYADTKKEETIIATYSFIDSIGNNASYSISYTPKTSHDKIVYVENVSIVGCQTSNPDQYNIICGDNAPLKTVENINKDDTVSIYNETATIVTVTLVGVAAIVAEIIILTNLK